MGKKVRRSISVLLLAFAIAVTQIPPSNAGAMNRSDFIIDGTTLISYEGTDYSVSIPRSVEKIGQNAFENNMSVEQITIPSSVEEIEAGAFAGCGHLREINIPTSVNKIGSGAFANCLKLSNLSVAPQNKYFRCVNGALYNKDVTKLYQVLAGRGGISYTFPNSVKEIDKYAFWGCENIERVYFGNGLEKIPEYAFSNCRGLTEVTIPNKVTSIELKAFEDCVNLEEVYIPPSVISIHETAFDGCGKIRFLYVDGTVAEGFAENYESTSASLTDYEESENMTNVRPSQAGKESVSQNQPENAFSSSDVSDLDMSKLPDGMEKAESSDVMGKTKIVSSQAVVFLDNTKMQVYSGESGMAANEESVSDLSASKQEQSADLFYDQDEIVEKYVIVNGNIIADRAFYKNSDLVQYEIPDTIERIGDFAFAYTKLTSMTIPHGVKSIGYGAFYKCNDLSSVTIPQTVNTIEPAAFEGTSWLENWKNGPDVNDFLVVGNGILIAYKGNSSKVTLPYNVKKVGANVFEGHEEIVSVTIPDSVSEVGEEAFKDCTALKNVSGGNNLEKICDRAFLNCPLETIRIPASVLNIGLGAFSQENNGKSDSVVFLGNTFPEISYEKTTTRFTNSDFRKPALSSVEVAVVNNEVKDFENTILDDKNMGFRGIVCSILKEPAGMARGTVCVKYVSNDDKGYPVNVPDVVWIYGKEYDVEAVETTAYHDFSLSAEIDTEQPEALQEQAEENTSDAPQEQMSEGTSEVPQEQTAEGVSKATQESNIHLEVTNEDYKENTLTGASFSMDAQDYVVTLGKNQEEEAKLKEALETAYGKADEENFLSFDLSMRTIKGSIPISNLGKERLTVSVPVRRTWIDTPIVAVCLDNNGQLEFSLCKQYETEEGSYVTFEAKHFSPYGLYQGENVPKSFQDAFDAKIAMKKGAEYNIDYGYKDVSPDTGDYLEPKWFLAIGLLALSLFLFFKKDGKNIMVKTKS